MCRLILLFIAEMELLFSFLYGTGTRSWGSLPTLPSEMQIGDSTCRFQGWMQGALQSGLRAAREVVA